jgi:hypothetical protein
MKTAEQVEQYAEDHLFDGAGLMMSGIDSHTNQPFAREFITEEKVPRRALFDPWSYWTYEDTIMTMGHYIDGLVLKYEVTGDENALTRAREVWRTCKDVYMQSRVYGGPGSFLRPYGGFDEMERFGEPLGTDQAAPLFCGVWRLMQHSDEGARQTMADVMIQTLCWYADQGYTYRYYKSFTVPWIPPIHHAASFYLPAIALAANVTGEDRWHQDLETYLTRQLTDPKFTDNERGIWWGFKQGGLLVLKDILGDDMFAAHFTPDVLERMHREIKDKLAEYDEPGMLKRDHPESAEPGFEPYMKPGFDRSKGFGAPRTHCVHGGRRRPRHEAGVLAALAGLGVEGAAEDAANVLCLRRSVPEDFTHILAKDYEALPPAVHLYARSIGAVMLDWWRNVWLLRRALHDHS